MGTVLQSKKYRETAGAGKESGMFRLMCELYPLHRTINSDDFEKSLGLIGAFLGERFQIHSYEPGSPAFTWFVPYRYHVDEAYLEHNGRRYADFSKHNLSVVSYSVSVDKTVSYEDLKQHVYTSEALPDEIPWCFKYYEKDWGFCLSHNEWKTFDRQGTFRAVIRSRFEKEPFQVGEFLIPGNSKEEILWVSDICHPSQVNDSLTGAVVAAQVAKELQGHYDGHYSLRFLFLAETIGSIVWFSRNEDKIPNIKHGMFCEMLGNNNRFLLKRSRQDNALIDRVAASVLARHQRHGKTEAVPFLNIVPGNDERVMNAVGIDIPSISITRWPYPEYHTTADNPSMIAPENLEEAKAVFTEILHVLNTNLYPVYLSKGPIFLSRYGLHVSWYVNPQLNKASQQILVLLDGKHSVFDIAGKVGLEYDQVHSYLKKFEENKLIRWSAKPC